jgi:hypothetical protein
MAGSIILLDLPVIARVAVGVVALFELLVTPRPDRAVRLADRRAVIYDPVRSTGLTSSSLLGGQRWEGPPQRRLGLSSGCGPPNPPPPPNGLAGHMSDPLSQQPHR